MPRPTKNRPELGDARTRLIEAGLHLVRLKGFGATSIEDLCRAAEVTKGSYFHHFRSKEAFGVALAEHWAETTGTFFAAAPYHAPADPLERVLAYVAFRRAIVTGEVAAYSCLAGTLVQEIHAVSEPIRQACGAAILGHAGTLEADIAAAMAARGMDGGITPASLARHMQGVLQGAFVLAKAGGDPEVARESLDHLDRYIRLLFDEPTGGKA